MNTGAPSAPQVSVQPPSSGKARTIEHIPGGIRASLGASDAHGKSNGSNRITVGSGGDHLPAPSPDPSLDTITSNPTADSEKILRSNSEIAAIKRRCAASLLALIPPTVARTFFGLEPGCGRRDRTCSAATGSSSTIASYPPSIDEKGGVQSGSLFQAKGAVTSSTSRPLASTNGGNGAGERQCAYEVDVNPEEDALLDVIENDLLDVFSDEYCNKHLVYSVIETVLAKVLPEMTERSVADLMEDRGVAPVPGGF